MYLERTCKYGGIQVRYRKFKPQAYLNLSCTEVLEIAICLENHEYFVYHTLRDSNGNTRVSRSLVRCDSYGNLYFVRNKSRFYLREFEGVPKIHVIK